MTSRHERTAVPYSADAMYDIVADVMKYPDFIPWCVGMRLKKNDVANGSGRLVADMLVQYKVFREKFRSEVALDKPAHTINVTYLDGPFRHLVNTWRFEEGEDGGSVIDFHIEFEFKNPLLQMTAMTVLDKAFARLSEAFVARAHALYGKTGA